MKKRILKKVFVVSASVFLSLVVVLSAHIYYVTRLKAPDPLALVMARVDIRQPISQDESNKITAWLYQQKGIDHVLCNANSEIVVFTFFPVRASADEIVKNLKANFNLEKASRFIPSAEDLKNGCPVAANSFSYKVYSFIRHIF